MGFSAVASGSASGLVLSGIATWRVRNCACIFSATRCRVSDRYRKMVQLAVSQAADALIAKADGRSVEVIISVRIGSGGQQAERDEFSFGVAAEPVLGFDRD